MARHGLTLTSWGALPRRDKLDLLAYERYRARQREKFLHSLIQSLPHEPLAQVLTLLAD